MLKRLRWLGLMALAILALMALAACGDDDEGDSGSNGSDANNDAPASLEVPVINHDASTSYSLGDPAPAFSLPNIDGDTVSLADYEEPVLLFFHMAGG